MKMSIGMSGCPALLQWLAGETGSTPYKVQLQIGGSLNYATGMHPCGSCSQLQKAATILADKGGERIAALAKVVNDATAAPGPITEEQMAVIANNFADHAGDGTYYAKAGEWIDALVAYVGIMNNQLRYSPDQSLAFANKYYGPQLDSNNAALASYVAARIASINTNIR
jgi:hypothetical protein